MVTTPPPPLQGNIECFKNHFKGYQINALVYFSMNNHHSTMKHYSALKHVYNILQKKIERHNKKSHLQEESSIHH